MGTAAGLNSFGFHASKTTAMKMTRIENRVRYDGSKLHYPSGLTDEEWALVEPLISAGGGKRTVSCGRW